MGLLMLIGGSAGAVNVARTPEQIIQQQCVSCHVKRPDGSYVRISEIRATPEGWELILNRMQRFGRVVLTADQQAAMIKHLADSQGLAPEETAPFRYIIEQRPNHMENPPNEELALICGSCHSYARAALDRRDAPEWLKLINFHEGQYPSLEYHSRLRSIEWWKISSARIYKDLAQRYPFSTTAWTNWRQHHTADLSGNWRVYGHQPGVGDYAGTLTVAKSGEDRYTVRWTLKFADGKTAEGDGAALVYTGYEWRGATTLAGKDVRQVLAVAADGQSMNGRWFYRGSEEVGGDISAVRVVAGESRVLAVQPSAIRAGSQTQLTIVGTNLSGDISLGNGIKIVQTVSNTSDEAVVVAEAGADADGLHDVAVGNARGAALLRSYSKVDSVRIEPDYAIARVGGNGGPLPPVIAQFEAIGYLYGADGKPGGANEVRIGTIPAKWSVEPFDEVAADLQDVKFAGQIDDNGTFTPAGAGPNPARRFGTDNTGNLKVVATLGSSADALKATGHLVVTVQRWVDAPLR